MSAADRRLASHAHPTATVRRLTALPLSPSAASPPWSKAACHRCCSSSPPFPTSPRHHTHSLPPPRAPVASRLTSPPSSRACPSAADTDRLPRPRLRRLDVAGEGPLVPRRRLAVRVPDLGPEPAPRCGRRARANAVHARAPRAGRGVGCLTTSVACSWAAA
jgi:hypothetical protein